MCNCNSDYNKIVGGERAVQNMLANFMLGVQELFTTLLEEPLSKCHSFKQKLVVIDALDEAEYWSRDDFLDLIMNRFPRLPNWLLFFITSRPEDTVEFRLKTYNPCVRICAGNSESVELYQQHEQDIERFLEKRVNFSDLQYSSKQIAEKCNGMFLYAFYIVDILKNSTQLNDDVFPETINDYFRKNFKRVYEKVGKDFYQKLFGCVLIAPSPLPISFISFLLRKEGCALDEQEVIDAVSLFVQTTNQTFTFLHNLIPAWLTDEKKASRRLSISRNEADALFRNIIFNFLNDFLQDKPDKLSFVKPDLVHYILDIGFRFFSKCCSQCLETSKMVFNCLTNYRFLQQRIQGKNVGIYSLIKDLEFSICCSAIDKKEEAILDNLRLALVKDKNVIAGCPELLCSCLRNASELTQETIIRNKMSSPCMETIINPIDFGATPIPSDMDCCAFSHDEKLFAGGQGRWFFLFDTRTFQKVLDPIEVIDSEKLSHLEFSSDDKFVFFGRLDKWFSVQDKRVVEISQFAGNVRCYKWGSFVYDGSYIVVIKNRIDRFHLSVVGHILAKWWLHEIGLEEDKEYRLESFSYQEFFDFCQNKLFRFVERFHFSGRQMVYSVPVEPTFCKNSSCKLCSSYAEFEKSRKPVRDCVVNLYSEIFEFQIWNVETGESVIKEMFSIPMKPFFYIWHVFPEMLFSLIGISITEKTITKFAAVNLLHCLSEMFYIFLFTNDIFISDREIFSRHISGRDISNEDISYLSKNAPAQCCNHIPNHVFSQDGKWLAKKIGGKCTIFRKVCGISGFYFEEIYFLQDAESLCCTNNNNVFVCFTHKPNETLFAFSVQTGSCLESISGFCPISYVSDERRRFVYVFCSANERITIFLSDLPRKFLLDCLHRDANKSIRIVETTFSSTNALMLLHTNGVFTSWKIGHGTWPCSAGMLELVDSLKIIVKKCAFSHDGKLIALHHSCEILLFNCDGKFLSSVFKVTNEDKLNASFLTFSSDDSLLMFCVQKHNNDQSFHVWEVNGKILSKPIYFPLLDLIDSCCFASDNSKIFFCNTTHQKKALV